MHRKISPQYRAIVEYCAKRLIKAVDKSPYIIGITGESGSGKSTFCAQLRKLFNDKKIPYSFVNIDDFLIPREVREKQKRMIYKTGDFAGKSHWEIFENWYFHDEYERVLQQLKNGKTATHYCYDHTTGKTGTTLHTIYPKPLILVENPLFIDHVDFLIRFDVDREIILGRKIVRDADTRKPEEVVFMHNSAQGYFWDRKKPQEADIIIDNNDFASPQIVKG